jgi:CDP-paratose 2-epimerase
MGTLNLLEATRRYCRGAAFIFASTNKVYGDTPNRFRFTELATRWDLPEDHPCHSGIDESMSIDQSQHSLFGASKASADILVQEYGRTFGMNTVCFRCGCVTGPAHAGVELHGFLHYLMQCVMDQKAYFVCGHGAKQVRDNIHSRDLVQAFWEYFQAPRPAEVYNMGGGRSSTCSMLEAIWMCENITTKPLRWRLNDAARPGDHRWYVSDTRKFQSHYPEWRITRDVPKILQEIYTARKVAE